MLPNFMKYKRLNKLIYRNSQFRYGYICMECARERGGTWPECHCATFHVGICGYCWRKISLCNIGDWDWPDGLRRGMRD